MDGFVWNGSSLVNRDVWLALMNEIAEEFYCFTAIGVIQRDMW